MLRVVHKLPKIEELGFGSHYAPQMLISEFKEGAWRPYEVKPLAELSLHPGARVLHYSQEIFEGLKAFKSSTGLKLFRPQKNISRMTRSAEILAMPPYDEAAFLKGLKEIVNANSALVPDEPGALYLRPTMIGTSTALGVAPATEYLFYIVACPVGGYFGSVKSDKPASIAVYVSDKHVRAVRGGLGAAKTGANYAASLLALSHAKKAGYQNVLFLDAIDLRYVEELSGMNFFIVENGVLKTPSLGDTILDGVTRKSLMELASRSGIQVLEEKIDIHQLVEKLKNKKVTEVFACGTGASITAIKELFWKNEKVLVGSGEAGEITSLLYKKLLNIQFSRENPPEENWMINC